MNTRLSVVTTVYNGEEYVDRAVPSILRQSYEDFEYIILDDGSTDDTLGFLESLREEDPRVEVLSPGRLGRAAALNYAIEAARGEYIAIQDFDDASYPLRLECQVDFLDHNPGVGAVGSYYVLRDLNRGEEYVRKPPVQHSAIVRTIPKYIPMCHTCVTMRKRAWAETGGYPHVEDIEDLMLWVRMIKKGWRLANVPRVLGEHWVHPKSFWHTEFSYASRQVTLMKVQMRAIHELPLPKFMYLYPLGRLGYSMLPAASKRWLRRTVGNSNEIDIGGDSLEGVSVKI